MPDTISQVTYWNANKVSGPDKVTSYLETKCTCATNCLRYICRHRISPTENLHTPQVRTGKH